MTISEKAKFAAVKRRIKAEFAANIETARRWKERNCPIQEEVSLSAARAYLNCFRMLFCPEDMPSELVNELIKIRGTDD